MLYFFKNIVKQYKLHKTFQHGLELIKIGKQEDAFNEFKSLLKQEPYNPHVRRQLLELGKQLHKEVNLPKFEDSSSKSNYHPS